MWLKWWWGYVDGRGLHNDRDDEVFMLGMEV